MRSLNSPVAARPRAGVSAGATRHAPEVRRALIVEAAAHLLAKEGLVAATARRIGREAGVSIGTLTHHFASMDDLLAEALRVQSQKFAAQLEQLVQRKQPALSRLRALAQAIVPAQPAARKQWRLWFQFWSRAALSPRLARLHVDRYEAWRGLVERVILSGVQDGQLRKVDARAETLYLTALADGLCIQVALGDPALSSGKAIEILFRAFTDRLR